MGNVYSTIAAGLAEVMSENILKKDGLSLDKLKELSYRSNLGIRLKKNLHYFDKDKLLQEVQAVNEWYDSCVLLRDIVTDYRVKSIQSAELKYERYYPIEIQYNTYYDRQLNNWLHKYIYKSGYGNELGCALRKKYEDGKIRTEKEFKEVQSSVLFDCKEI